MLHGGGLEYIPELLFPYRNVRPTRSSYRVQAAVPGENESKDAFQGRVFSDFVPKWFDSCTSAMPHSDIF